MSERLDLMATFDARWTELSTRETVPLRPDSTITPRTLVSGSSGRMVAASGGKSGLPNPATLPRISLGFGEEAADAATASTRKMPDLVVCGLLGEGGMGRVHLARQQSLGRDVAVKTLKTEADPNARYALLSEAVIMGFLEHPGIIPVHVLGTDESGKPVLVMKRVDGVEWRELLCTESHAAWGPLDARFGDRHTANLQIVMDVCNAVHFAHSRGVLHRDIKPENIMIGSYGEVYLADFGIAIRTDQAREARELVGTPAYMAPEMVAGLPVDVRTDVYLLGATLHEVLTGKPRHDGAALHDVLLAAFESAPYAYDADVPKELAELCARATSRNQEERPETALDFRRAISAYLEHRSSLALSDAARQRLTTLRALLDDKPDENRIVDAHGLAAQARFGFEQALEQWPENPGARQGHEECLRAMVEIELHRENPAAARALLDKLSEIDTDLGARTTALEERLARRRREHERLEIIARELDPNVSLRQRLIGAILLACAAIFVSGFALYWQASDGPLTPRRTFLLSTVFLSGVLSMLFVLRHHFLRNEFNRRFVAVVVMVSVAIFLDRGLGWIQNRPVEQIFVTDLLLGGAVMAVGAFTVLRWLGWVGATFATGAFVTAYHPAHAGILFSLFTLLAILLAIAFWRRTT